LDLNKDQFYLKLLERANQDIVANFALDRGTRALLISKTVIEKGEDETEEDNKQSISSPTEEHVIRITTNV